MATAGASGDGAGRLVWQPLPNSRQPAGGPSHETLAQLAATGHSMPAVSDGAAATRMPAGGLSHGFLRSHEALAQLAQTSHSMPAVSDDVLAAKRTYTGPMVTDFVMTVTPRLDVPEAVMRLLDPHRPGAFLACRCSAARQQEYGSCFLQLYVLDPEWLAKTCRGAVRLAKAIKGKDRVNMARGTGSFRTARRAKAVRMHGQQARASGAPANRFVCARVWSVCLRACACACACAWLARVPCRP